MIYIKSFFSFLAKMVIVLAAVYGLVYLPKAFNYQPLIITDDAMSPTYPPSSIVYYKETNYKNIVKGNIITYKDRDKIKCSRVIDIDDKYFTIRNDNSANFDEKTISSDNLLGENVKVIVQYLGAYITFINNNLTILLSIGGGILLISFIFIFIEPKEKQHKKVISFEE